MFRMSSAHPRGERSLGEDDELTVFQRDGGKGVGMKVNPAQISIKFMDHDGHWIFNAKWKDRRIGYVWCTLEENRLHISDFVVEQALCVPWSPRWLNDLRCFLRIACPRRNFRGLGIGSRLMDVMIDQARRTGIFEAWGSVTMDDIKATKHLLSLYESRGFEVLEPDEECLPNAAKKILLTLDQSSGR